MNKSLTIAFNELRLFVYTSVAPVLGFAFYVTQGILFWYLVNRANTPGENLEGNIISQINGGIVFWLMMLILIPIVSMRLFAFETENKSLPHLFSAPLSHLEILLGKFFGGFFFYILLWVPTLLYVGLFMFFTQQDWAPVISGYLGIFLCGAFFLSAGLLCSLMSSTQMTAAVSTFFLLVILLLASLTEGLLGDSPLKQGLAYFNFVDHFSSLSEGILDTRDIFFFILSTLFFLLTGHELLSWKRDGQSFKKALSPVVFLTLCLGILGLTAHLSLRHYLRSDLTQTRLYSLGKASEIIAGDLKNTVDLYVYFKPEHEMTLMLRHLLKAYESGSKKIRVRWIDPYYDYAVMQSLGEIGKQFRMNTLLFKTETRHRFLTVEELGVYDKRLEQFGLDPKLIAFNGEAAISGTLMDLSNPLPPKVGFISNHGERSPADTTDAGIQGLVRFLMLQGIRPAAVDLNRIADIPDDVEVLVSAGPRIDYTETDLALISRFLRKGGSVLFALDPYVHATDQKMMEYNLPPLLRQWGILLENTIVVDPSKQIPYSRPDHLYIDVYSDYEITNGMKQLPTLYFQARSLAVEKNDSLLIAPLAATSDKGWGESRYTDPKFQFDEKEDRKGPVYIAVAAKHAENRGKMIVFGDSDFLSNSQIHSSGNGKLIENCLYWLLNKADYTRIPPKPLAQMELHLGRSQLLMILAAGVVLPPVLIVLLSFVFIRRRSRG